MYVRRMIALHLILTCYGFWLPNDPRGSWSDFVHAFDLWQFGGEATTTRTRASRAARRHDRDLRRCAKDHLKRPPVSFNGRQALEVARGFADYATRNGRRVFAAAILPEHVHLVVAACDLSKRDLATHFKGRASSFLRTAGIHPFQHLPDNRDRLPSPWAKKEWGVFLYDEAAVVRAVEYVEDNPIKAGLKPQHWNFAQRPAFMPPRDTPRPSGDG